MSDSNEIMGARIGGFAVLTGNSTVNRMPYVVLLQRGVKYEGTSQFGQRGCFGGHVDIENGEQPGAALLREIGEELIDDQGNPVLTGFVPEQFRFIANGLDTATRGKKGPWQAGTFWNGYHYALSEEQEIQLAMHERRLFEDPAYMASVVAQSNGEFGGVHRTEAYSLLKGSHPSLGNWEDRFAYSHELSTIQMALRPMFRERGYDV